MQGIFMRSNSHNAAALGRLFAAALMILLSGGLLAGFRALSEHPSDSPSVSYWQGVLQTDISYDAPRSGWGTLTVEVLDPDNGVLGRSERKLDISAGRQQWRERVRLEKALAIEDLVWQRLRYRFRYDGTQRAAAERIYSISQLVRIPVVQVIGQNSYLAGGRAALRLIVTDPAHKVIAAGGTARIDLDRDDQHSVHLFRGALDGRGTADVQFTIPAGLAGSYSLHVAVETAAGSTDFTQPIRVEDKVAIHLSTEKPVYQPGQVIHVRALALDRANHQASAGRKLVFELEDSRGNKVFKKVTQTDEFGVASAEFGLAEEVNLGTYHLRATFLEPNEENHNSAEMALNVDRYVLPKFKVAVDLADKSGAAKRGYRPGDHVTGTDRKSVV